MKAAVEYAEGQIRRLLGGQVELWELPLTGGLWRVTGGSLYFDRLSPQAPQPLLASSDSALSILYQPGAQSHLR